jgi:hypothetical protein
MQESKQLSISEVVRERRYRNAANKSKLYQEMRAKIVDEFGKNDTVTMFRVPLPIEELVVKKSVLRMHGNADDSDDEDESKSQFVTTFSIRPGSEWNIALLLLNVQDKLRISLIIETSNAEDWGHRYAKPDTGLTSMIISSPGKIVFEIHYGNLKLEQFRPFIAFFLPPSASIPTINCIAELGASTPICIEHETPSFIAAPMNVEYRSIVPISNIYYDSSTFQPTSVSPKVNYPGKGCFSAIKADEINVSVEDADSSALL